MKLTFLSAALLMASVTALPAQESEAPPAPTLKLGDPAPPLAGGRWIQGGPIKELQKDKIYVMEFWATWCGPCRATIPHLNELHQKFQEHGVTVIGQNVWENEADAVEPFVKEMGAQMTFPVVLDDTSSEPEGVMASTWLQAAGRDGIPSTFLVGRDRQILWIGHPAELSADMLQEVVDGKFDPARAAAAQEERQRKQQEMQGVYRRLTEEMQQKKWDAAEQTLQEIEKSGAGVREELIDFTRLQIAAGKGDRPQARSLAAKLGKDESADPRMLNALAWQLAVGEPQKEDLKLAAELAGRANEATQGGEPQVLDTLARIEFLRGNKQRAIELQSSAVEKASPQMRADLEATLESYRAGRLPELD